MAGVDKMRTDLASFRGPLGIELLILRQLPSLFRRGEPRYAQTARSASSRSLSDVLNL